MKLLKEKGITLIALVVTIILLLILSIVTLGTLLGDNGLIGRTKKAVEYYEQAQKEEELEIDRMFTKLADLTGEGSGVTEAEIKDIVNKVIDAKMLEKYPVGSIYITMSETNPSEIIGGEWEQIKDRFLLGAGDNHELEETGGEETHKLTINEMPSHCHYVASSRTTGRPNIHYNLWAIILQYSTQCTDEAGVDLVSSSTTATGGSQPHNNMPPYLTVYIWKRIS